MAGESALSEATRISLLLSDIDGTLVTREKVMTPRTIEAVKVLKAAGVAFAVVSSRPPAGLAKVAETLGISTPVVGFNGGMIVDHSGNTVRKLALTPEAAAKTIEVLQKHGADVWVFNGNDWVVSNVDGHYVKLERRTIGYDPIVVEDFSAHLEGVTKIVGSSQESSVLQGARDRLDEALGSEAAVSFSQPYYLDITHEKANKGGAVMALSEILLIPASEIATIGDGENDTRMFAVSGFSVAMGNALPATKEKARAVTGTNEEDGFADAVERYILPRAPKSRI